MRSVTKWYSDDGKEFETREDCISYEKNVKNRILGNDVFLWDEKGRKITFSADNLHECSYMKVNSDSAAEKISVLMQHEGIKSPWDPFWTSDAKDSTPKAGSWFWDDDAEEWKNIDLHYKKWRERMAVIL